MTTLWDILKANGGLPVNAVNDSLAQLWKTKSDGEDAVPEALPVSFTANGLPLKNYRIYGTEGGLGKVNLFDKTTAALNKCINGTSITDDSNWGFHWAVTDYIPVKGGGRYFTRVFNMQNVNPNLGNCHATFGDGILEYTAKDGQASRSSQKAGADGGFVVSASTNYIRVGMPLDYLDNAAVYEGSNAPTWYGPYGKYCIDLISGTPQLYDSTAGSAQNGFMANYCLFNGGQPIANSSYDVTEYIEITAGKDYILLLPDNNASVTEICFYTADKTIISALSYKYNNVISFTAPENTCYCRFSAAHGNRAALYSGQRVNITLDKALNEGEYVDYKTQARYNSDGTVEGAVLPAIPTSAGTNTLTDAENSGESAAIKVI